MSLWDDDEGQPAAPADPRKFWSLFRQILSQPSMTPDEAAVASKGPRVNVSGKVADLLPPDVHPIEADAILRSDPMRARMRPALSAADFVDQTTTPSPDEAPRRRSLVERALDFSTGEEPLSPGNLIKQAGKGLVAGAATTAEAAVGLNKWAGGDLAPMPTGVPGFTSQHLAALEGPTKWVQEQVAPPDRIAEDLFVQPSNLVNPEWWAYHAPTLVGTALPFLVTGLGGMAAGGRVAAMLKAGPKITKALQAIGGTGASTIAESLFEGSLAFQEALDKTGGDREVAARAASEVTKRNLALIGTTNLPIFTPTQGKLLAKVLMSAGLEGGQEGGQEAIQNIAARTHYDPSRDPLEGVGSALALGGVFGAAEGASTHGPGVAMPPPPAPPVPDQTVPPVQIDPTVMPPPRRKRQQPPGAPQPEGGVGVGVPPAAPPGAPVPQAGAPIPPQATIHETPPGPPLPGGASAGPPVPQVGAGMPPQAPAPAPAVADTPVVPPAGHPPAGQSQEGGKYSRMALEEYEAYAAGWFDEQIAAGHPPEEVERAIREAHARDVDVLKSDDLYTLGEYLDALDAEVAAPPEAAAEPPAKAPVPVEPKAPAAPEPPAAEPDMDEAAFLKALEAAFGVEEPPASKPAVPPQDGSGNRAKTVEEPPTGGGWRAPELPRAFDVGREDFALGKPRAVPPEHKASGQGESWLQGWDHAKAEAESAKPSPVPAAKGGEVEEPRVPPVSAPPAPTPPAAVAPAGEWTSHANGAWRQNDRGKLEVRFAKKPSTDTLAALKSAGFRWAKGDRVWYAGDSKARRDVVARVVGGPVASAPPAKPSAVPEAKPPVDTPAPVSRADLIEQIVAAARDPEPELVERHQVKGTDGKWYDPLANSMPWGVRSTREYRPDGWALRRADGVFVGVRHPTREEALAKYHADENSKSEDFRAFLRDRATDDELLSKAAYWLKDKAPRAIAPDADAPALTAEQQGFTVGGFINTKPAESKPGPPVAPKAQGEAPASGKVFVTRVPKSGHGDWTEIGRNAIGHTLYEDSGGIRSYIVAGVRRLEPVQMIPRRDKAGNKVIDLAVDRTRQQDEWVVVSKPAPAGEKPDTKPAPVPEAKPQTSLSDLTAAERRELRSLKLELDEIQYTAAKFEHGDRFTEGRPEPASWTKGHGNAPVYQDIMAEGPSPIPAAKLREILADGLAAGTSKSVWWEQAITVARGRAAGKPKYTKSQFIRDEEPDAIYVPRSSESALSPAEQDIESRAAAALENNPAEFKRRYVERFGETLDLEQAKALFEEYAGPESRGILAPARALYDALAQDGISRRANEDEPPPSWDDILQEEEQERAEEVEHAKASEAAAKPSAMPAPKYALGADVDYRDGETWKRGTYLGRTNAGEAIIRTAGGNQVVRGTQQLRQADPSVEIDEFGRVQPALPGTEDVRRTENATPQFDAPFTLDGGRAPVRDTSAQTALFEDSEAKDADADGAGGGWPWPTMDPSRIVPPPNKTVQASHLAAGEELSQEEAARRVESWKAEARRVGKEEDHSHEVVLSLFDRSGVWSRPYEEAGYQVVRYDIANGDDLVEFMPTSEISEIKRAGFTIVGVLAAPPCTSFAVSGARWWETQHDRADVEMVEAKYGWRASRYFDTPLDYANTLVAVTQAIVEFANPTQFHVIENPVGRIASQNDLPKPLLAFDPSNFGDPYTKKTLLWGDFNPSLPTANVTPEKGSYISVLRGDDPKQKALRSLTPEGFAYAFFMANHRAPSSRTEADLAREVEFTRERQEGESKPAPPVQSKAEAERAALKAERDRLMGEIGKKLNQVNTGFDPELGKLTFQVLTTYVKEGVVVFREVVARLVDEYGEPFVRQLAPYLDKGWQILRKEAVDTLAVVDDALKRKMSSAKDDPKSEPAHDQADTVRIYEAFVDSPGFGVAPVHTLHTLTPQEARKRTEKLSKVPLAVIEANPDIMHDAVEAAFNTVLTEAKEGTDQFAFAQRLEGQLPRAHRSLEKLDLQQFSTPLPIAVAAVRAARLEADDLVLEPTAGTGNLLAPIDRKAVGGIVACELSPRRAALLRAQGYKVVHEDDYLTTSIPASVIITNPPWGKYSTGKYGKPIALGFSPVDVAERFVAKNIRDLDAGGRLVAVMPTTMLSSPDFKRWLMRNATVRAVILSPPGAYKTRATNVESALLVVDKVPSPAGAVFPQPIDSPTWEAYLEAVEAIHARSLDAAPSVQPPAGRPSPPASPAVRPGAGGSGTGTGRPGPGVGSHAGTGPGRAPVVVAGNSASGGRPAVEPDGAAKRPAPKPARRAPKRIPENPSDAFREASDSANFAPYLRRTDLRGPGHPKLVVEAKQLAGVDYPEITIKPGKAIQTALDEGRVSVEQAEQALAAVQANIEHHHGYLAADAVGVGKSREIALVILDLMERAKADGRPLRLLVTTKNADNIADLVDAELHYVATGRTLAGVDLAKPDAKPDPDAASSVGFEIVKVGDFKHAKKTGDDFAPLPSFAHAIYVVDSYNLASYREALQQVGLHGVVGDEAHRFKNAAANVGAAWQSIHAGIMRGTARPHQVFAYFTATPAQSVEDYAYLFGLRLWPIDGFEDWLEVVTGSASEDQAKKVQDAAEAGAFDIDHIADGANTPSVAGGDSDGGPMPGGAGTPPHHQAPRRAQGGGGSVFMDRLTPAESEQITREWKVMGRFSARDLWRKGTEFEIHTAALSAAHRERYEAFTSLARAIIEASNRWGAFDKSGRSSRFGPVGMLQFAAKRVQMDAAIDEAVVVAKQHVESGHQVVLSLINVSEMSGDTGHIAAAIDKINARNISVSDSGDIVDGGDIPEALIEIAELRDRAKALGVFESPIEQIEAAFGPQNVAFVVGGNQTTRQGSIREFQAGKRPVAVISAAGSTGISLDHRVLTDTPARGRRVFIDVQYEWSATEAIQRYGRVDRASSVTPPKIIPISFGNAAERKFLATIANRMASMGAASRGGAEATGANALEEFEIAGPEALAAARRAYEESAEDVRARFAEIKRTFRDPNDPTRPRRTASGASMQDFQLALLFMPLDKANLFWERFVENRAILREASGGQEARRTMASRGEILARTQLTPTLELVEVRNEKRQKFGILSGVVTPQMPKLRTVLSSDIANDGRVKRTYVSFQSGDEVVAGLSVKWGKVDPVLRLYEQAAGQRSLESADDVRSVLAGGALVVLAHKNPNGDPWTLRQRPFDGRFAIDNALMAERDLLGRHGAAYRPIGNLWYVPEDKLEAFIERFPVDDMATRTTASGGTLGMSAPKANTMPRRPGGLMPLPRRKPPAVPPKKQMRVDEIVSALSRAFDRLPVSKGRFRQRALGVYKVDPQAVRTRLTNDLRVIAHEFGHHIDEAITKASRTHNRGAVAAELKALGKHTAPPSADAAALRKEGAAEFFAKWMTEPDVAQAEAPAYFAIFEAFLADPANKELATKLREIQNQTQGYLSQSDEAQLDQFIDFEGEPSALDKVVEATVGSEDDPRTLVERLNDELNDDVAVFARVERDLAGGRPTNWARSAYVLRRLLRGVGQQAQTFIEDFIRRPDGTIMAQGLYPALKLVWKHLRRFSRYLAARRAQDYLAAGQEPGLTRAQIKAGLNVPAELRESFERATDLIDKFNDALLEWAVQRRFISRDQKNKMQAANPHYVPFHRVSRAGDLPGQRRPVGTKPKQNISSFFKRKKGDGGRILDPVIALVKNVHTLVRLVEQNNMLLKLVDLADGTKGGGRWIERVPPNVLATRFNLAQVEGALRKALEDAGIEDVPDNLIDPDEMATVFAPAVIPHGDMGIITVLRDGKREWWEIHDQVLWDALVDAGPKLASSLLLRSMQQLMRVLKATATASLGFISRNVCRDTLDAKTKAEYDHSFLGTLAAAGMIIRNDESWQRFRASRAGQATVVAADRDIIKRQIRNLGRGRLRTILNNTLFSPFDALRALSELSENASRLQSFVKTEQRLAAKGVSGEDLQVQSALTARESTQDFSKLGRSVRAVNDYVAFFGPMVGGWTRAGQAFKANPVRYSGRAFLYGILPGLLLWALNHDDDDYEEIEGWAKKAFWHIKIPGTHQFIWVPRPFDIGEIGNYLEAYLDWAVDNDPDAIARLPWQNKKEAWQILLELLPTAVLPIVEWQANYSFFRDHHIVSAYDSSIPVDLQYNRWTSETAKYLGPKIGLAPAHVDHLIYGYTAGMGRGVTKGIDLALSATGVVKSKPQGRGLSDVPGLGSFVRGKTGVSATSASLTRLYRELEDLEGLKKGVKRYVEVGEPEKARRVMADSPEAPARLHRLQQAATAIRAVRKDVDDVFKHPTLSSSEKRDLLDRAYEAMTNIARNALGDGPLSPRHPEPIRKDTLERFLGKKAN